MKFSLSALLQSVFANGIPLVQKVSAGEKLVGKDYANFALQSVMAYLSLSEAQTHIDAAGVKTQQTLDAIIPSQARSDVLQ